METQWVMHHAARLEQWAQFAHRRFAVLASGLFFAVLLFMASDHWFHWIEAILPFSWIDAVGEGIGETAFLLGFAATLYYDVRDAYATARRMKLQYPSWLDPMIKYCINVLRLGHPFLGSLVFSIVLLHGYVMWKVWAGGNYNYAVETGLTAASILLLVGLSGMFIRWMPKMHKLRLVHRLVGFLFVLAFVIHRIVAD